ncbi:MAG TPA: hypothetical protein VH740_27995 [Vicinamibacterales bacterium]|jgi:hypothetical protein
MRRAWLWLLPLALAGMSGNVAGQQAGPASPRGGISLSPSVVMLSGQPGQAYRQQLRLTNHTARELAFRLEAQDVVADEGRRAFIAAGERAGSVAATAVFSPREIVIAPGAVGIAEVTLTLPSRSSVRGVAAIFRGQTIVGTDRGVAMTASLGSLITFTLSDDVRLDGDAPEVSEQTESSNLAVTAWVSNVGSEPVVASGAAAFLNEAGALVGKVALEPQRFMPGERLAFRAEYPALLAAGRYRAILSLEYDDHARRVLTRTAEFAVPTAGGDRPSADRGADVRR